jgi:hypothetical protein
MITTLVVLVPVVIKHAKDVLMVHQPTAHRVR